MKNSPHHCNEKPAYVTGYGQVAIIILLFCLLFFTACKGTSTENSNSSSGKSASPAGQSIPSGASEIVSGTCANAYYPVAASVKREYRVSYENNVMKPATYTETLVDITPDSFKVKTAFAEGGTGVTHGWKCSGDGLAALEYANVNVANQNQSNMQLDIETISAKGVFVPSENNWKVGYKWSNEYNVAGTMKGTGSMPSGEMKSNVTLEHEIIGEESVTVPAGTFTTFKVKSKITQKGSMQMTTGPAVSVPMNVSFDLIMYQAKGIGLVKSVIENAAKTELLSYTK
jgi:hypothetical protein